MATGSATYAKTIKFTTRVAATALLLALAGGATAQEAADTPAPAETTQTAALDPALAGYERTAPTPGLGQPIPAGINVQPQFTPTGHQGKAMLDYVLNPLIGFITALVLILMAWCIIRYRAAANPVPSKRAHNFTIEVLWTVIPALLLLGISFPSYRLIANQYFPPKPDLTVKVTGYQWYWGYEYPDYGDVSFDSLPLSKEEAEAAGEPYLLDVDNRLVVPAGAVVKVLVTAADVIHSFAIPSFWIKMDAVPGRINQTWFKVDRPGVYYGQCSELCGVNHGFMPIAIDVKSPEDFLRWMRMKQAEDGVEPTGPGIATTPEAAAAPAADPNSTIAAADSAAPALEPAA